MWREKMECNFVVNCPFIIPFLLCHAPLALRWTGEPSFLHSQGYFISHIKQASDSNTVSKSPHCVYLIHFIDCACAERIKRANKLCRRLCVFECKYLPTKRLLTLCPNSKDGIKWWKLNQRKGLNLQKSECGNRVMHLEATAPQAIKA